MALGLFIRAYLFPSIDKMYHVLVWLAREMPEDIDFLEMSHSANFPSLSAGSTFGLTVGTNLSFTPSNTPRAFLMAYTASFCLSLTLTT